MRRDSIFYKLFQQFPTLLFELLNDSPENAAEYRFDSVSVKEPRFEIDGVFLPPENDIGTVYFCEVQFQKDEQLYERVFAESLLYFYRNRSRFQSWQIAVIYPTRRLEQANIEPYRALLDIAQVHRIYLDELGEIQQLPLGSALMVLTTIDESEAAEQARGLLARSQQAADPTLRRVILELVTTIMVYKFTNSSRREVEAMLGLSLQETRVYQEAKAEGREEQARSLLILLLTQKFGTLPDSVSNRLSTLTVQQLEACAIALLTFTTLADLEAWLNQ